MITKRLSCGKYKKYIISALFTIIILFINVWKLISNEGEMSSCVFCDIVSGHSPTTIIEKETDHIIIFKDIRPASTYHFLAVPKQHIESLKTMTKNDIQLVEKLETALLDFLKSKQIVHDAILGFHMPPFISVKHLHLHGIAPRSNMSFVSRMVFKPHMPWFKRVDDAKTYLLNKS